MSEKLFVSLCFQKGDMPFISSVNGKCTIADLNEIEREATSDSDYFSGDCEYVYQCDYFSGQYGEYGRCEISPGWELSLIKYTPLNWRVKL